MPISMVDVNLHMSNVDVFALQDHWTASQTEEYDLLH